MSTVRAKFTANAIIPGTTQSTVFLNAVYSNKDGSRNEENKAFSDATPAGMIQISIANDKPALQVFETGKSYYVDFTPAD